MYDILISGLNVKVAFAFQGKVPIAVGFEENPGFKYCVYFSGVHYTMTTVNRFSFKHKAVPEHVHFVHFLN